MNRMIITAALTGLLAGCGAQEHTILKAISADTPKPVLPDECWSDPKPVAEVFPPLPITRDRKGNAIGSPGNAAVANLGTARQEYTKVLGEKDVCKAAQEPHARRAEAPAG